MDAYTGEIHRIFPLCNRVWPIALPVVEALCPNHAFACSRTHKTQGLRIVCHHKLICCWGAMQVLQIKKDEEERKKKEEDEERTRMERERERVRKDREREMRLKARQDEEVRRRAHSGCNIRTVNNRIHLRPHIMPGFENARRETPLFHLNLRCRLTGWQPWQERLQRQAAELRRKLAGIHPDGPSREERYYRRLQQIDNGEIPSRGTQSCHA
jgi:hypothetical protein